MQLKIISFLFLSLLFLFSCSNFTEQANSPKENFTTYCASCHLAPDPANIPKRIWKNKVLPEMAARLGYRYNGYNPMAKFSMEENLFIRASNIYPTESKIDSTTWNQIHAYILENAPEEIKVDTLRKNRNVKLTQFVAKPISLDEEDLSVITNIQFDSIENNFIVGNAFGKTTHYPSSDDTVQSFKSPLIAYQRLGEVEYFTEIGFMNPSQKPIGATYKKQNGEQKILAKELHRPVYSQVVDLNEDGMEEILICEFGNLTGQLSMLTQVNGEAKKRTLLPLPGTIKTEVVDLNNDGKKDIIVLASQGKEGIYILYQEDNLQFRTEQVIEMGSEYGSSWFELIDYDGDADLDIILANGDNADYSVFSKPYHGIRIFLNNGENEFEEKWFYPIYGATRFTANDYDSDGDIDLAVIAFFPDYAFVPKENFVFLENKDAALFDFESSTFSEPLAGRFLVLEEGDVDEDGDMDLVLGSFMLFPGRAYKSITDEWVKGKADLFLLENQGK